MLGGLGKGMLGSVAPKKKAIKIEQLVPKNPEAKRIRMTWGPLRVKGANVSIDFDWRREKMGLSLNSEHIQAW